MTVAVELPDSVVETIVERVAEVVLARVESRSPWMTRKQAAAYLGLPLSRLEKARDIPSHRDSGRVLYNRDELDGYFLSLAPCGT